MSQPGRVALGMAIAVVALVAVAAAWFESVPAITAHQAVELTETAFRGAGIVADVEQEAVTGSYQAPGRERVDVWKTVAAVDGGSVLLYLDQGDGDPVYIDDRSPNGSEQVLSEAQFEALVDHAGNPALTERLRRNLALTLAAAAILAVAIALVTLPPAQEAPRS